MRVKLCLVMRRRVAVCLRVTVQQVCRGKGWKNGTFLQYDNLVRMDWLWSNAMGGIKLLVRQKEAEEAEHLLSQAPPEEQTSDPRESDQTLPSGPQASIPSK
jgi:hypothetical protein